MIISNNINSTQNINFKAKFFYTDDLNDVVKYAVGHGKFDKLNQARKNIDSAYLVTRLKLNILANNIGEPTIQFTRMVPKKSAKVPYTPEDYFEKKTVCYDVPKGKNPLKIALERIIKLGNNAPDNKMFKTIVINHK